MPGESGSDTWGATDSMGAASSTGSAGDGAHCGSRTKTNRSRPTTTNANISGIPRRTAIDRRESESDGREIGCRRIGSIVFTRGGGFNRAGCDRLGLASQQGRQIESIHGRGGYNERGLSR